MTAIQGDDDAGHLGDGDEQGDKGQDVGVAGRGREASDGKGQEQGENRGDDKTDGIQGMGMWKL